MIRLLATVGFVVAILSGCSNSDEAACRPAVASIVTSVAAVEGEIDPAKWVAAATNVRSAALKLDQDPRERAEEIASGLHEGSDALAATIPSSPVHDNRMDTDALSRAQTQLLWATVELVDHCK